MLHRIVKHKDKYYIQRLAQNIIIDNPLPTITYNLRVVTSLLDVATSLYKVVDEFTLTNTSLTLLKIDIDGKYKITIEKVVATNPTNFQSYSEVVYINNYKTLLTKLIREIKDALCNNCGCNCSQDTADCKNKKLKACSRKLNLITSLLTYDNLTGHNNYPSIVTCPKDLVSSFIEELINENRLDFLYELNKHYRQACLSGEVSELNESYNKIIGIYYLVLYLFDYNIASRAPSILDTDASITKLNYIDNLYDIKNIKKCIVKLGLNIADITNRFEQFYLDNTVIGNPVYLIRDLELDINTENYHTVLKLKDLVSPQNIGYLFVEKLPINGILYYAQTDTTNVVKQITEINTVINFKDFPDAELRYIYNSTNGGKIDTFLFSIMNSNSVCSQKSKIGSIVFNLKAIEGVDEGMQPVIIPILSNESPTNTLRTHVSAYHMRKAFTNPETVFKLETFRITGEPEELALHYMNGITDTIYSGETLGISHLGGSFRAIDTEGYPVGTTHICTLELEVEGNIKNTIVIFKVVSNINTVPPTLSIPGEIVTDGMIYRYTYSHTILDKLLEFITNNPDTFLFADLVTGSNPIDLKRIQGNYHILRTAITLGTYKFTISSNYKAFNKQWVISNGLSDVKTTIKVPPTNKTIKLDSSVLGEGKASFIMWGDGTINEELEHTYEEAGDYQIAFNVYPIDIIKLPYEVLAFETLAMFKKIEINPKSTTGESILDSITKALQYHGNMPLPSNIEPFESDLRFSSNEYSSKDVYPTLQDYLDLAEKGIFVRNGKEGLYSPIVLEDADVDKIGVDLKYEITNIIPVSGSLYAVNIVVSEATVGDFTSYPTYLRLEYLNEFNEWIVLDQNRETLKHTLLDGNIILNYDLNTVNFVGGKIRAVWEGIETRKFSLPKEVIPSVVTNKLIIQSLAWEENDLGQEVLRVTFDNSVDYNKEVILGFYLDTNKEFELLIETFTIVGSRYDIPIEDFQDGIEIKENYNILGFAKYINDIESETTELLKNDAYRVNIALEGMEVEGSTYDVSANTLKVIIPYYVDNGVVLSTAIYSSTNNIIWTKISDILEADIVTTPTYMYYRGIVETENGTLSSATIKVKKV